MQSNLASIPKLGFGTLRLPLLDPEDQKSVDVEQLKNMVDVFMASGCTYFDTAFVYHGGKAESALKQALVDRYPRDAYTIATKCFAWTAPNKEVAERSLSKSLERLGLDYVDFYLLHNVGGPRTARFDEYGMWDFLKRKKEEGLIRSIGFSMHDDSRALEALLTAHPEIDFVQLQVNYLDWNDPVIESRACMEVARDHGVPVVIMEPARGGLLADLPPHAAEPLRAIDPESSPVSWAYRFCWDLPGVVTVLSGMSTIEQVRENTELYRTRQPLSPDEKTALEACTASLRSMALQPCTNCRYCMESCPQNVQIPEIIALMNLDAMSGNRTFVRNQYSWRVATGPASTCIGCAACEAVCPQQIRIASCMSQAAEMFE
jgi:predicted aldo/keto reductase-like oxidoreductase